MAKLVSLSSWSRSAAPIAGGTLIAIGCAQIVMELSTSWIDAQIEGWPHWIQWPLVSGLILVGLGVIWCIWFATTSRKDETPASYDAVLARLGFALVVTGMVTFIGLFGLASRGLLVEIVRPSSAQEEEARATNLAPAPAASTAAPSPATGAPKPAPATPEAASSKGRELVVWAARLALLPTFAVLGSLFFISGSLQRKRDEEEEEGDSVAFSSDRFWSGFWYRVGEGLLFALVAFLASYAGLIDGDKAWSGFLLLLGLLMAMFVKPAEKLVNGLALRLFEAVSAFTDRTVREATEGHPDPLTAMVSRLNDASETVRLQAVSELEAQAKARYSDVMELLASFVRQRATNAEEKVSADVQRAFIALGTLAPSTGKPRAQISLRGAQLNELRALDNGLNLAGYDLTDVNLSGARLQKTDFSGADVAGASLSNALLQGARLAEAKNLEQATLEGATYNDVTTLPAGFDPAAKAMVAEP